MNFLDGIKNIFTGKLFQGFDDQYNYWLVEGQFNDYYRDKKKLAIVFQNPAVLKVFSLQCDLFSLGKVYVYRNDKAVDSHPVLDLLKKPNFFQSGSQFLWDFMFWRMCGNAYLYLDSTKATSLNRLYFLDPAKIDFPPKLQDMADRMVLSQANFNEIQKIPIRYNYTRGGYLIFNLSKLITFVDTTNGTGNWWKGNSKIDALYKVIANSEESLNAKNINTRFSGKFLVSGKNDIADVTKKPMSQTEKDDIETKMLDRKQNVHAIKSMIDVKRFVENLKNMELSQSYLHDFFVVGNMYNIPRDVLEAYASATYENQEKARAAHVNYTLDPAGEDFAGKLHEYFGMQENEKIVISWDHLPFVQVFEKDLEDVRSKKVDNLDRLLRMGMSLNEANRFLDTDFKPFEYQNNGQQQQENDPGTGEGDEED